MPDDTPDAGRTLDARRELATLRQAIETLPTRQRWALLLRAIAKMGTANITAALNISTGATEQLPVPALRRQLASALSDHKADFRARAKPTHQSPHRLHRHSPTL